jgi:hypothetical protein
MSVCSRASVGDPILGDIDPEDIEIGESMGGAREVVGEEMVVRIESKVCCSAGFK